MNKLSLQVFKKNSYFNLTNKKEALSLIVKARVGFYLGLKIPRDTRAFKSVLRISKM